MANQCGTGVSKATNLFNDGFGIDGGGFGGDGGAFVSNGRAQGGGRQRFQGSRAALFHLLLRSGVGGLATLHRHSLAVFGRLQTLLRSGLSSRNRQLRIISVAHASKDKGQLTMSMGWADTAAAKAIPRILTIPTGCKIRNCFDTKSQERFLKQGNNLR
jgi:hypothetical protein